MKHRIGKFYVLNDFLDTTSSIECINKILTEMKFIPTKVDFLYAENKFEYIGISHMFNELKLGVEIPEYIIEVSNNRISVQEIIQ